MWLAPLFENPIMVIERCRLVPETFVPSVVTLLTKEPVVVPRVLTCPASLACFTGLLTELEVLSISMTLSGLAVALCRPDAEETVSKVARKLELPPPETTPLLFVFASMTLLVEMAPLA